MWESRSSPGFFCKESVLKRDALFFCLLGILLKKIFFIFSAASFGEYFGVYARVRALILDSILKKIFWDRYKVIRSTEVDI